nr:immunoglobulin light chain junction region [Macaca mulatta]
CQPGYGFPLTF